MKILFYDWALHNLGGGQKFDCKVAEHLSKKHNVDILTLFPVEMKKLEIAYGVDFSRIRRVIHLYEKSGFNSSLLHLLSFMKVSKLARQYDLFFNADAHETVKPLAKYNIMYCHFFDPKWYKQPKNFFDFLKVASVYIFKTIFRNYAKKYDAIYCNSFYTKKWLKKLWNVNAEVIYPPVDIPKKIQENKENLIISTGRLTQDKNYEFVIDCFKEIYDSDEKARKYKCFICGVKYENNYFENLKKQSVGYPIKIFTDLNAGELGKIYSRAKIFIQAKGFGIDEKKYPALLEHFGMSAAEAMAYGCVPILLNKGGYREIVKQGKNGFLFNNQEEAIEKLKLLISNEKLWEKMSRNARERAEKFSLERLRNDLDRMMQDIQEVKK